MSQANVEIVQRLIDLWNGPGIGPEQLQELFDPTMRFDLSRRELNPAVYDGYDGFDRFVSDVGEVWEKFSIELKELIDGGSQVISVRHVTGRGQGSGIEVEGEIIWLWTIVEGRVVRVDGDLGRGEALEAAGLSE